MLALVVVIAVVMNRSEDKPTYDSDFFPEGNSPERDYPYIDTIQQWSVPYTDPYQIVAMGRKACQLLGQLPDTEAVEATMHEHAPNYTDDQIRRIVRPPTATYAETACCGCELEAADSDS